MSKNWKLMLAAKRAKAKRAQKKLAKNIEDTKPKLTIVSSQEKDSENNSKRCA